MERRSSSLSNLFRRPSTDLGGPVRIQHRRRAPSCVLFGLQVHYRDVCGNTVVVLGSRLREHGAGIACLTAHICLILKEEKSYVASGTRSTSGAK